MTSQPSWVRSKLMTPVTRFPVSSSTCCFAARMIRAGETRGGGRRTRSSGSSPRTLVLVDLRGYLVVRRLVLGLLLLGRLVGLELLSSATSSSGASSASSSSSSATSSSGASSASSSSSSAASSSGASSASSSSVLGRLVLGRLVGLELLASPPPRPRRHRCRGPPRRPRHGGGACGGARPRRPCSCPPRAARPWRTMPALGPRAAVGVVRRARGAPRPALAVALVAR